jgi:hypothetical protein
VGGNAVAFVHIGAGEWEGTMSGHPIIAVGALSADSAAIRAALPGDSHRRRFIDDPFCWIGRFAEDDVYLCC